MYDKTLEQAEKSKAELLKAYDEYKAEGERFRKLLGKTDGTDLKSLIKKYGPRIMALSGAGAAGGGITAFLPTILGFFGL